MATKILAGTSGYSYKGWQGTFYPEKLPQDEWLSYYAGKLPTVEINNTFYRMPREHVVEAWRDAVPARFRFVIKASRRITHMSRLKDADESTGYLLKRTAVLGDKLGAVLFQLPPYLKADTERLSRFQDLLPDGYPAAFEFRHESWLDADVEKLLSERQHTLVVSHDDNSSPRARITLPSTPLLYVRLRASSYTAAALKKWHTAINSSRARTAFVFFKHEDAGVGPKLAGQFLSLDKPAPKRAAAKPARRKSTGSGSRSRG